MRHDDTRVSPGPDPQPHVSGTCSALPISLPTGRIVSSRRHLQNVLRNLRLKPSDTEVEVLFRPVSDLAGRIPAPKALGCEPVARPFLV